MEVVMEVRQHLPLAELERLVRKEPNARRAKRLRIIILAMRGYTAAAIAMSLGLPRRACQDWVHRFNAWGSMDSKISGVKNLALR